MMKRYFSGGAQEKGDPDKRPEEDKGNGKEKDDDFPIVNNCFMIFDGPATYDSRRQLKLECQEVYVTEPAMLAFLDWFRSAITFDRDDHSDHAPQLGRYPLVVDPIIDNTWLTKVLMDGGSGLNLMYAETLDAIGSVGPSSARVEHLSTASYRGSGPCPLGKLTYLSPLGICPTSGRRPSPSRWWGSVAPITPC
jgi:hypothetical protein